MQILEVEFFGGELKCKFRKSKLFCWGQYANFRSQNFVIGAQMQGNGMAAVGIGCILWAVQLGGGAKAGGFCPAPEVAAKRNAFIPRRSDLARNGQGLAVI